MLIRQDRFSGRFHGIHRSGAAPVQSHGHGLHGRGQTLPGRQAPAFQCSPCLRLEPPDDPLRLHDHRRRRRHKNGVEMHGPGPHSLQKLRRGDQPPLQLPRRCGLARPPHQSLASSQQRTERPFRRHRHDF